MDDYRVGPEGLEEAGTNERNLGNQEERTRAPQASDELAGLEEDEKHPVAQFDGEEAAVADELSFDDDEDDEDEWPALFASRISS